MSPSDQRRGVYPGSFNPPTIAHLEISRQARDTHDLDVVVWSVSTVALAKEHVVRPRFSDRLAVLRRVAAELPWLDVQITEHQLLVDISDGYDVLIMGADKWHQIQDPTFYGDDARVRDEAMDALPTVAVAPRPPLDVPEHLELDVPSWTHDVSSTGVRAGHHEWMLDHAAAFDTESGAWTDAERYEQWVRAQPLHD
ncbi:MAG: hypothetical protein ACKVHU_05315 [Acidimicrobiales bacterium]